MQLQLAGSNAADSPGGALPKLQPLRYAAVQTEQQLAQQGGGGGGGGYGFASAFGMRGGLAKGGAGPQSHYQQHQHQHQQQAQQTFGFASGPEHRPQQEQQGWYAPQVPHPAAAAMMAATQRSPG